MNNKKEQSVKQQLATNRNWLKYRLTGNYIHAYSNVTEKEKQMIIQMEDLRKQLIKSFDENSIKLGLKVKEKCYFCRNKPIHNLDYGDNRIVQLCNKCFKEYYND